MGEHRSFPVLGVCHLGSCSRSGVPCHFAPTLVGAVYSKVSARIPCGLLNLWSSIKLYHYGVSCCIFLRCLHHDEIEISNGADPSKTNRRFTPIIGRGPAQVLRSNVLFVPIGHFLCFFAHGRCGCLDSVVIAVKESGCVCRELHIQCHVRRKHVSLWIFGISSRYSMHRGQTLQRPHGPVCIESLRRPRHR